MSVSEHLHACILHRIQQKQQNKQLSYEQVLAELIIKMGYDINQQQNAIKRLQQVIQTDELGLPSFGLLDGCYDYKYSSLEFLTALCKALEIQDYQHHINQMQQQAYKTSYAKAPIVITDIAFNSSYKPSYLNCMAVSVFTHVKLADDIRLLDREEQIKAVRSAIKKHFEHHKDSLPYEGVIKGYKVTVFDDKNASNLYVSVPMMNGKTQEYQ